MNNGPTSSLKSRLRHLRRRFLDADERAPNDHNAYREITSDLRDQSLHRHEKKIADISDLQDEIRLKLIKRAAIGTVLLGIALLAYKAILPSDNADAPQSLATWLEQQKMLRQVAQVQQWLNTGEAQSDLPPPQNIEELRAWLEQIQLSPDLQKLDDDPASGEPGFVPFQCTLAPIACTAEDVPSAPGEGRQELGYLVRNANSMLVETGNCIGTVNLIGEYNSLFGWRKSEAVTKSLLEISVAKCFMKQDDTVNAQTHYTRAYCSSVSNPDPHEAMTSLYGLAKIAWLAKQNNQVQNYVQCSERLLDYHLRTDPDVNTLNNYITLALMHYELTGDTRESIRVEEKGLAAARELATSVEEHQVEDHLEVMLILQMNLMEGYLTFSEREPLYRLHEELKSNPMLEDGDRLVARGLLVMQDLIDNNLESANENLQKLMVRYRTLTEFNTVWSWDAFDRWQEESKSTRSVTVDEQIKQLRIVLASDRPADSMQRLANLIATVGRN